MTGKRWYPFCALVAERPTGRNAFHPLQSDCVCETKISDEVVRTPVVGVLAGGSLPRHAGRIGNQLSRPRGLSLVCETVDLVAS